MNLKQFAVKVIKGAVTGGAVSLGVMLKNGVPLDQHGLTVALSAVSGAAFHGLWNAIEQALDGGQ